MMSLQIQVDHGICNEERVVFSLPNSVDVMEIVPAGKMITDSENNSFVYLIDGEEGYGQIHFTSAVWSLLLEVLKSKRDPLLVQGENSFELINFIEELEMLIFNIEGNSNYGELFSAEVETVFAEILEG